MGTLDSCRSCFSDAGLEEMVLPPASCWHFRSPSQFLSHVGAAGTAGIYQTAAGIAAQQNLDVSAVTVGLRYDVEPGFALKTDVTWYSDDLNDLNDATLLKVGVNYTF